MVDNINNRDCARVRVGIDILKKGKTMKLNTIDQLKELKYENEILTFPKDLEEIGYCEGAFSMIKRRRKGVNFLGTIDQWCKIKRIMSAPLFGGQKLLINGEEINNIEVHSETIEDNAFLGCSSVKTIVVGPEVKSIGMNVFGGCNNLTDIYWYSHCKIPYDIPWWVNVHNKTGRNPKRIKNMKLSAKSYFGSLMPGGYTEVTVFFDEEKKEVIKHGRTLKESNEFYKAFNRIAENCRDLTVHHTETTRDGWGNYLRIYLNPSRN